MRWWPIRLLAALGLVGLLLMVAGRAVAAPQVAKRCPTATNAKQFAGVKQLRGWNRVLDRFGVRTTGNRNHRRYVNWLEDEFDAIPGMRVHSLGTRFTRLVPTAYSLEADLGGGSHPIPVAAPLPYAAATGKAGITAPLTYVPRGTEISGTNAGGRVVVRDLDARSLPNSAFELINWFTYDPHGTIDPAGTYKREWIGAQAREDMQRAAAAGAAGLLFVHELPRREIEGQYRPYQGDYWPIPAFHLGVDEGTAIENAIVTGAAGNARLVLRERRFARARTRMLIARLPGPGKRRFLVQTHSDGTNALWDNGSVPMLAIARYFSRLPRRCRPGPMDFVFSTAHLFQSLDLGHRYVERVDREYDRGRIAMAVTLEHLGGREWEAVPRGGGLPGLTLVRTGRSEIGATFVTESDLLVQGMSEAIQRRGAERSVMLKGTSIPDDSHVPPFCSFGGEGTAYVQHLIPTVGFITAPWPLFDPGYKMSELIDFRVLRRQSLTFSDLLLRVRGAPQGAIAGKVAQYRAERAAGKPTCPA